MKVKAYIKRYTWVQYSLIWLGLLVVSGLGMNNNYHALSWLNLMIPVYQHEELIIFWGNIVLMIAIYNLFRAFYYTKGNYLFNKDWKCFICTLIFISLLSDVNVGVVQKVRSTQSGLKAIYLDREDPLDLILYQTSAENIYRIEGVTHIKNCSDEIVGPFQITIAVKSSEEQRGGCFTCQQSYILAPGEEKFIDLSYEGILSDFVANEIDGLETYVIDQGIEMMFWNHEEKVIFYSE